MTHDPNRKTLRSFQCRDYLWEVFQQMGAELECSVDYLVNESMRQYARSRNYGSRSSALPTAPPNPNPSGMPGVGIPPNMAPPNFGAPPTAPASPGGYAGPPAAPMAPPAPPAAPASTFGAMAGRPPAPPAPPGYPPAQPPGPPAMSGPTFGGAPQLGHPAPRSAEQYPGGPPLGGPPLGGPPLGGPPLGGPPPIGGPPPLGSPPMGGPPPLGSPPLGGPPPIGGPPPMGGPPPLAGPPPAFSGAGARPSLFVIFNGQKVPVTKDEFIIGRGSKTADLPIKDGNISRRHAAIVFEGGAWCMRDLGSTNGIEYHGQRVDVRRIEEGDVFHLCDYELRFTYR